jgi:hypothetical protein
VAIDKQNSKMLASIAAIHRNLDTLNTPNDDSENEQPSIGCLFPA